MRRSEGQKPQALVTGASSGIGRVVAENLQGSHEVFGVARRDGPVANSVALDLGDLDALPDKLQALTKRLTQLEVVVLAAGYGRFGSLEQQSYSDISQLIDVNLTANVFLCRALLPLLKRRGAGKVIFIGSEAALRGKRQGSVYCASKFAIRGLAQSLRDECAGSGVAITIIEPGMVRTPFFDPLTFEPGPDAEHALVAEDVAAAVEYVLSSPARLVVDEIELSPLKHVVRKTQSTD